MNGLHGIIFSYEQEPGLRELAERRMPASIPFGGRYRVVDFMLSNLHAAGHHRRRRGAARQLPESA